MKRLLSLLLVTALLAGCTAPAGPATDGTATADEPTIAVSASGTASDDPDLAVVDLRVETTADAADDARERVARDVASVRTALTDAGVPAANVTTTAFGITPVYDYVDGERRFRGYRAVHALSVETAPDRAGAVVDLAVGAGATSVDGVRFTLSDDRRASLRATALDRAMAAARTDADGIADAADLSVTGVRHASTGADVVPYAAVRFEDAAGAGDTVLDPAPVTVRVTVDVTYVAS